MVSNDRTSAPRERAAGDDDRRSFFATVIAVVVGGLISIFPFAAGLLVLFDPLRRQGNGGGFLRIAALDELPADGVPRSFPVITDRIDAWNKFINEPVGMVFLRRDAESGVKVEALNAVCPHAGCFVDFLGKESHFQCPCHDSSFAPNGTRINPDRCPSPRDLDQLAVQVRTVDGREEVWVEFKNFRAGTPDKIADT